MPKNKNKIILIALASILCVAAASGFYLYSHSKKSAPLTPDQAKLQAEEKKANVDPKKDNEAYYRQQANQPSQQATPAPSGQPAGAVIKISSLSQDATNVYVGAIVDNQTSGTCILSLTKPGSPDITRRAPLGRVTSYYACQGFNVEKSAFPTTGEWSAVVTFSGSNTSGTSEIKKIVVE